MTALGSRFARAVFWALTWGVGVAVGVALGGWLTVVGGAATPGVESLDIAEDLIRLPLLAGGAIFAVHLVGQGVIAVFRRQTPSDPNGDDNEHEEAED